MVKRAQITGGPGTYLGSPVELTPLTRALCGAGAPGLDGLALLAAVAGPVLDARWHVAGVLGARKGGLAWGLKLNHPKSAGFSPCLPSFHFGYL